MHILLLVRGLAPPHSCRPRGRRSRPSSRQARPAAVHSPTRLERGQAISVLDSACEELELWSLLI
jgi:hypothetical protein